MQAKHSMLWQLEPTAALLLAAEISRWIALFPAITLLVGWTQTITAACGDTKVLRMVNTDCNTVLIR